MKKLSLIGFIAGSVVVGGLGFAAPAFASESVKPTSMVAVPAGVDHLNWLDQVHRGATAPRVDSSVQQSR